MYRHLTRMLLFTMLVVLPACVSYRDDLEREFETIRLVRVEREGVCYLPVHLVRNRWLCVKAPAGYIVSWRCGGLGQNNDLYYVAKWEEANQERIGARMLIEVGISPRSFDPNRPENQDDIITEDGKVVSIKAASLPVPQIWHRWVDQDTSVGYPLNQQMFSSQLFTNVSSHVTEPVVVATYIWGTNTNEVSKLQNCAEQMRVVDTPACSRLVSSQ